jgi:HrpA-like RNA helicase
VLWCPCSSRPSCGLYPSRHRAPGAVWRLWYLCDNGVMVMLLLLRRCCCCSGSLTPLGHRMSALPVEPRLASLLLKSEAMACAADMIDIVAMLGGDNVFFNPKDQLARAAAARAPLVCSDSDHVTLLNVLRGFIASGQSVDWCKEHYLNRRYRVSPSRELWRGAASTDCARLSLISLLLSSDLAASLCGIRPGHSRPRWRSESSCAPCARRLA